MSWIGAGMNWTGAIARLFGKGEPMHGNTFREAAGVAIDDDEDQWRPITGAANRDLSPLDQRRMRALALHLWERNMLANRIIELPVAFIFAEGVRLTVADDKAQTWLDAFWHDPINQMDIHLPEKARELALFGEQFWPAFINDMDGHVRIGCLDPELVETVVFDPDNAAQPIGVVTVKDRQGNSRRYRVIVNGPEEIFTERTQAIRETFTDGDIFYFAVNRISTGRRGRSDILASMDWMDSYEQFLFGELDRAQFLRAFLWDVELTGATPDEVRARARDIAAPRPGSVRVHNDSEKWSAVTPGLGAEDSAANARLFRNHVLGGGTLPEHWYGGGGDVNRAAASEMGEPTFKVMSMRQMQLRHILESVGTYVIRAHLQAGGGIAPDQLNAEFQPTAVFPELTARDTSKYAAAFAQVVAGGAAAVDRGLLSEATVVRTIQAIAGRLGVEFEAEEELAAAREDAARQTEADSFPGIAPDQPAE